MCCRLSECAALRALPCWRATHWRRTWCWTRLLRESLPCAAGCMLARRLICCAGAVLLGQFLGPVRIPACSVFADSMPHDPRQDKSACIHASAATLEAPGCTWPQVPPRRRGGGRRRRQRLTGGRHRPRHPADSRRSRAAHAAPDSVGDENSGVASCGTGMPGSARGLRVAGFMSDRWWR